MLCCVHLLKRYHIDLFTVYIFYIVHRYLYQIDRRTCRRGAFWGEVPPSHACVCPNKSILCKTLPPTQFGAPLLHAPVGNFEREGLNVSCGCTTRNSYSGFFNVCNPRFNFECQFFPCNMEFFRSGPYVAGSKINNCVSGRCAVPRIETPTMTRLCPLCCMYIGNFDDIRTRC